MDIYEQIKQSWNDVSLFSKQIRNKEFVRELKNQTAFLDEHYSKIRNKHRAYVILHQIQDVPMCECGCGLVANLNQSNPEQGFRKFYNNSHALKNKCLTITKEELYQKRIVEQKSIEQIAQELNSSEVTVRNKIKEYDLDSLFDARQRNSYANVILSSKEELLNLYEQNLTTQQIAEKLNTSKATVSRWLSIHSIKTRSSNSYPRKINKISKEESELYDFVCSVYDDEIVQSNRSILDGKELDIYLPNKNLAIEYNGLYSHLHRPWEESESLIKGPSYHLNKTLKCQEQGIQLLQFFSDEWKMKKSIVQSIIKSKLGLNDRLYARKCSIIELNTSEKNLFLEHNHIQGKDKSKIKLGLTYENNLVAVMTFTKSRFNSKFDWELSRFACLRDLTIVGGFSKLLNHFRQSYHGSIVSYADRRLSYGDVYQKNGFNLIRVNKPSYYYVDKNCLGRYHRMNFQKKLIGAESCSEYEKAREMGYERIWDCGTLCFGLTDA